MNDKLWIIEPRDPLILRDGRSFESTPGVRAATLNFPFPTTIIGTIRTRAGIGSEGVFESTEATVARVKGYGLRGPTLVRLGDDDEINEAYYPAPNDVIVYPLPEGHGDAANHGSPARPALAVIALQPFPTDEGVISNIPEPLMLLSPRQELNGKPAHAPQYWTGSYLLAWLRNHEAEKFIVGQSGIQKLDQDTRVHIALDPTSGTNLDGALFQTRGLVFSLPEPKLAAKIQRVHRLALAARTDAPMTPGLFQLGGERRLAAWRNSSSSASLLPHECPDDMLDSIIKSKQCRLLLLTPAHFKDGWRPRWLVECQPDLKVQFRAAALGRPQVISGWSLENVGGKKPGPRPSRRLAAAGSVYFLSLEGNEAAMRSWISKVWMQNVSDIEEDRRDGLGLATLGLWKEIP